jgi:hypothetical protein
LSLNQINERQNGNGVVISNELLLNTNGICRAFMNSDVKLEGDSSILLDAGDVWTVSFESGTGMPPLLCQTTDDTVHLFTTPTQLQYTNDALGDWCMLVEVNAIFPIITFSGFMFDMMTYTINLLKNGEVVSVASLSPTSCFEFEGINSNNIVLHDIIVCNPGDVLDFQFATVNAFEFGSNISSGASTCFATFKILSFQTISPP